MDKRSSAADRIRPFLRAMERSIDEARQERTCTPEQRRVIEAPGDRPDNHQRPIEPVETIDKPFDPTQMKARPKRRF